METLVNERVRHEKYGNGVIVAEELPHIEVEFSGCGQVKLFEAPFAFEQYLVLENDELQKIYYKLAVSQRKAWEEKRNQEIRQMEEERLRVKKESSAAKKRAPAGKSKGKSN